MHIYLRNLTHEAYARLLLYRTYFPIHWCDFRLFLRFHVSINTKQNTNSLPIRIRLLLQLFFLFVPELFCNVYKFNKFSFLVEIQVEE